MLPVMDLSRARAFYEECLGLQPGELRPDGKFVYRVGGSALALFPKPGGTKAEHTAISFQVSHIAASIRELKSRGVVFEDYDFPDFKTIDACLRAGSRESRLVQGHGRQLPLLARGAAAGMRGRSDRRARAA